MGTVWHAHDTLLGRDLLGRDVAMKEVYLPEAGSDAADVVEDGTVLASAAGNTVFLWQVQR